MTSAVITAALTLGVLAVFVGIWVFINQPPDSGRDRSGDPACSVGPAGCPGTHTAEPQRLPPAPGNRLTHAQNPDARASNHGRRGPTPER